MAMKQIDVLHGTKFNEATIRLDDTANRCASMERSATFIFAFDKSIWFIGFANFGARFVGSFYLLVLAATTLCGLRWNAMFSYLLALGCTIIITLVLACTRFSEETMWYAQIGVLLSYSLLVGLKKYLDRPALNTQPSRHRAAGEDRRESFFTTFGV